MAERYPEGYLPWLADYLDNMNESLGLPVPQPIVPQPAPQAPELNTPPCPTTPAPIELEDIEWGVLSPWQDVLNGLQDTESGPEGNVEQGGAEQGVWGEETME